jgi:hypothetical protein
MVVGEHRHRSVEGAVLEREALGGGVDARRRLDRPLRAHDGGRLDRQDVTIRRLVRTGSGADIEDRARIAQRAPDPRRDPRLGPTPARIPAADAVVELAGARHQAKR